MALAEKMLGYWMTIQRSLFPWVEEGLGKLTEKEQKLITILDMIGIEGFINRSRSLQGRPMEERAPIARAFVAKATYNIPTTTALVDRLKCDQKLRCICGWERANDIPSKSTFSRAFTEFTQTQLTERVHEALVVESLSEDIVMHISRDSTEIEVREKPQKKETPETDMEEPKPKRGRPRKGEEAVKTPTRLERQQTMTLEEMLEDLPKQCDVGTKKNSKGYKETWNGFKLHLDCADGQIPISCILTSASTNDTQVAIPLATMTSERVVNLYDLMDAGYDAQIIREHSESLGHVPIIDINTRRNKELKQEVNAEARRFKLINLEKPEDRRYKERTGVERVFARLKDEFGGRMIRVRGDARVMTHLMFAILALTADQMIRLAST